MFTTCLYFPYGPHIQRIYVVYIAVPQFYHTQFVRIWATSHQCHMGKAMLQAYVFFMVRVFHMLCIRQTYVKNRWTQLYIHTTWTPYKYMYLVMSYACAHHMFIYFPYGLHIQRMWVVYISCIIRIYIHYTFVKTASWDRQLRTRSRRGN